MKKLMSLMLGLSLLMGVAAFAQDTTTTNPPKTKKAKKAKKSKKAKTDNQTETK